MVTCISLKFLAHVSGTSFLSVCHPHYNKQQHRHVTVFTTQCTLVQSAVLRLHVVSLSVCLSVCVTLVEWHFHAPGLEILEANNCTDN